MNQDLTRVNVPDLTPLNHRNLSVYVILNALDIATTIWLVRQGESDANPLMYALWRLGDMEAFVLGKTCLALAVLLFIVAFSPRLIRFANLALGLVVAYNATLIGIILYYIGRAV